MSKPKIPVIGEPIYILSQNNFSEKVKASVGYNAINTLAYVAVDAIKVMSVGYTDDSMTKIVINKDYKVEGSEDSAAVYMNVEENTNKKRNSTDIFVDELEANAIAIEMNKQFKNDCKVILDVVSQVYHEYDNVISLLKDVK